MPWVVLTPVWAVLAWTAIAVGLPIASQIIMGKLRGKPKMPTEGPRSFALQVRSPAAPWRIVYGCARLAGVETFLHLTGTNNEYFHQVLTLTGYKVYQINDMYFDGVLVPLDGSGDATGKFAGYVHVEKHTGDPNDTSQPFPGLASAAPTKWTAAHLQRGRAKVYVRLKWSADLFPNGRPNITFDVKGAEVWDPRTSTTAYSENSALCTRDYLANTAYGMAAASTELDDAAGGSIRAAANICDEDVNLNPTGTEKRYTTNGVFDTSAKPADIMRDLLTPMAGYLTYINGKFGLFAGAWRTPTLTLTDGDLRGPIKYDARISRSEIFNAVKGLYLCPTNKWQPADFPAWTNATYEAEDGERIWRDLQLPFTVSSATAQRLAKIELERARRQGTLSLPCKLVAYKAQPGDVIKVTHDRFTWAEKTFEVLGVKLAADLDANENPILGVDLACRETDSTVYVWSSADEKLVSAPPGTTLPDGNVVGAPTNLILTSYSVMRADGARGTFIKADWTLPADIFVISGGRIHVEYKKAADSIYISGGTLAGATTECALAGVDDGVLYDVRIRSENSYGAVGGWVAGQHTPSGALLVSPNASYRPLTNPLTATDAGATATVNIAAFTMRVAGTDLSINSGAIATLAFATLYYIYYIDPDFNGGSVTYAATTVKENAMAAVDRFFVGSIRTPADGTDSTTGNNDGGTGNQYGGIESSRPASDQMAVGAGNPMSTVKGAYDNDASTYGMAYDSDGMNDPQGSQFIFSESPGKISRGISLTLKVSSDVVKSGTGTVIGRVRYSTNGGSTWTNIYSVNANRSRATDSVAIPTATNFSQLRVDVFADWVSGASTDVQVRAYEIWLEVVY